MNGITLLLYFCIILSVSNECKVLANAEIGFNMTLSADLLHYLCNTFATCTCSSRRQTDYHTSGQMSAAQ